MDNLLSSSNEHPGPLSPPRPRRHRNSSASVANVRNPRSALRQELCGDPGIEAYIPRHVSNRDRADISIVEATRPAACRQYDQIPMKPEFLIRQANIIAPRIAEKRVVFVGDSDGASLLLALRSRRGYPAPREMLVLDFDTRLLRNLNRVIRECELGHVLSTRRYNVFSPLPDDVLGRYDWFYMNPPYGRWCKGRSIQLFLTRGIEAVKPDGGMGCLIVPHDMLRPWTIECMYETQKFLTEYGWVIGEKIHNMHEYYLDDDTELTSSLVLLEHASTIQEDGKHMPFAKRYVDHLEIPNFYGREVLPPYPTVIT